MDAPASISATTAGRRELSWLCSRLSLQRAVDHIARHCTKALAARRIGRGPVSSRPAGPPFSSTAVARLRSVVRIIGGAPVVPQFVRAASRSSPAASHHSREHNFSLRPLFHRCNPTTVPAHRHHGTIANLPRLAYESRCNATRGSQQSQGEEPIALSQPIGKSCRPRLARGPLDRPPTTTPPLCRS